MSDMDETQDEDPREKPVYIPRAMLTEKVPEELNLPLIRKVLRFTEENPDQVDMDWKNCFAGHTCWLSGDERIEGAGSAAVLVPIDGDDPDEIKLWSLGEKRPYTHVSARARQRLGFHSGEANALFINVDPEENSTHTYREVLVAILERRGIDPAVLDEDDEEEIKGHPATGCPTCGNPECEDPTH